jgi:hypothetical protein
MFCAHRHCCWAFPRTAFGPAGLSPHLSKLFLLCDSPLLQDAFQVSLEPPFAMTLKLLQ